MLPFPVLDGGHIVMATVESIRRRPLNLRVLEVIQSAAVLLLLGLMAFLMLKDTGDLLGVSNKAPTDAKKEEKVEGPIEIKFLPAAERAAAVK
jgi:regulator of sigma E protease